MTISNQTVLVEYSGNGATTSFAITQSFQGNSELDVYLVDTDGEESLLVPNTDYSFVGGNPATSISMTTAPATGETLLIKRDTAKTQTADYLANGPFQAERHESTLDKIVQMIQELNHDLRRTIKMKLSETDNLDQEYPSAAERASKFAAYDSDGNPIASDGGISDSIPVSAFGETLIDDASASVARATLGFDALNTYLQNIKKYGAVGDGVADDTTAVQSAVTAAAASGTILYWPEGTYLTTASITNLHAVRHRGPGRIQRSANYFYVEPKTGQTNNLYCDDGAASDTADGLSSSQPIQQPRTAVGYLSNYGPVLSGSWIVNLAAGTYKGNITFARNLDSRDFIKIKGPTAGHPNVPTAIIDFSADNTADWGIEANDKLIIWLEDIKFTGNFPEAVNFSRGCYLQFKNVHVDGSTVGFVITDKCSYFVTGGIIENCDEGISELFGVTRDFATVADIASQMIIRDCGVALKAKENCHGHTDYLNIEDNDQGFEFHAGSTTNPKGASFKRNGIAIVLVHSEIHNEQTIVWGSGADANTRRWLTLGMSSELAGFSWNGDPDAQRVGHRPLVLLGSDYTTISHTGTTANTTKKTFTDILKAGRYDIQGKKFSVHVKGNLVNAAGTANTIRVLLYYAGVFATDVTIPFAMANNSDFWVEFDVTCRSDGDVQYCAARGAVNGSTALANGVERTMAMGTTDRSVEIRVVLADASDTINFESIEVFG